MAARLSFEQLTQFPAFAGLDSIMGRAVGERLDGRRRLLPAAGDEVAATTTNSLGTSWVWTRPPDPVREGNCRMELSACCVSPIPWSNNRLEFPACPVVIRSCEPAVPNSITLRRKEDSPSLCTTSLLPIPCKSLYSHCFCISRQSCVRNRNWGSGM